MLKLFFPILLLGLAVEASAADLRCQGDLMSPGKYDFEVVEKCGTPKWEGKIGEIKTNSRASGDSYLYITQMVYEVGSGKYILTFEGGRLARTEYLPR